MDKYAEIDKLKTDFERFRIKLSAPIDQFRKDLFFIQVSINNKSWKILVDDEYQDFSTSNKLINWFLILHSLELYDEALDFLAWSKQCNIDPSSIEMVEYYKSLANSYREIEKKLGKIDTYISSYDYSLRTGVVKALLKNN